MDDYPLLDIFWTIMMFFLWVMWLFLLFRVVIDIFGSGDLPLWNKIGWTALVILLPYVGVLVYIIARGDSMGMRRGRRSERRHRDHDTTGPTTADRLAQYAELRQQGVITDEEYLKAKADILA
ncbi:SHOCT domain-containing protein [Actinocorallia longicatena]|uniref:SHOCT domain-containing protein n=1 Tax=Actinocorallia longicatena TaxID=111803 RepID=A0ABP6QNV3_9ACTN